MRLLKKQIKKLNGEAIHDIGAERERERLVYYRKRIEQTSDNLYLFKKNPQSGTSILTTIPEVIEQVKLLVGEITSGNTNQSLKNELSELSTYLYKTKHINKSQYNKLTNLIL